jgi:hypothetical protein
MQEKAQENLLLADFGAPAAPDRRRLPRMRFACPMCYRRVGASPEHEAHEAFAESLSGAGLRFETTEELVPGTRLDVLAEPPLPITDPLSARVTVVRCELRAGDPDTYEVAAEIDEMR